MSSPDELKKALLALEQAVQMLNDLEKDAFLEVAAFAKPHGMVRDVSLCVMVLKGSKDVRWMGAKAMMADTDFLRSLVEFEISTLTDTQVKHVKAYISKNAVELEALRAISTAGTALLAWVLAIVDYYAVAQGKASSSVEADGAVDYTSSFPYMRGGARCEDYGGLPGHALSLGDDDGDDELYRSLRRMGTRWHVHSRSPGKRGWHSWTSPAYSETIRELRCANYSSTPNASVAWRGRRMVHASRLAAQTRS